jgi:hypothetical protein
MWSWISENPAITLADVDKYPELSWNWSVHGLSNNPNIALDFVSQAPAITSWFWEEYHQIQVSHWRMWKNIRELDWWWNWLSMNSFGMLLLGYGA